MAWPEGPGHPLQRLTPSGPDRSGPRLHAGRATGANAPLHEALDTISSPAPRRGDAGDRRDGVGLTCERSEAGESSGPI